MADENVVRPVFGKKKPATTAVENLSAPSRSSSSDVSDDYKHIGPLTGEVLVRAQKDLVYMLQNMDFVHQMRNKLERAGDTIFKLKDYNSHKESIRLRRQGLKSYSLEDICKETERTHELQWRRQPSYVGALTLEHHYRVQAALSLMPSEESPDNTP